MINSTFIIPIRIDSQKRLENINLVVNYLLKYTDSYIIVTERDDDRKVYLPENDRLSYIFQNMNGGIFHRTKILNEMLIRSTTPITVNYDADVLLQRNMYKYCENKILNEGYDLVYPFGFDKYHQIQVYDTNPNYEEFKQSLDENLLRGNNSTLAPTQYGHVQFFLTKSYISGYMENENFKEYAPEDAERGIRFNKLGYKVYFSNEIIEPCLFHLEHPRSPLLIKHLSKEGSVLFEKLKTYSKQQLITYYKAQEYLTKYQSKE